MLQYTLWFRNGDSYPWVKYLVRTTREELVEHANTFEAQGYQAIIMHADELPPGRKEG